jgi:hypothetical protein
MFDLFVLRDAAQRRVKNQFEAQPKTRPNVAAAAVEQGPSVRQAASSWALRLRLVSNR